MKYHKKSKRRSPEREDSSKEPREKSREKPSRESRERGSKREDYLHGILPIQNALHYRKRKLEHLYLKQGGPSSKRLEALAQAAKKIGVPVSWMDKKEMDEACPNVLHQGCLLKCGPLPFASLEDIKLDSEKPPVFLALDQVEDPHNLGAIIRSCAFFKISGIIVTELHSSGLTPTVSKTSAGTLEHFPVISVGNLARFLEVQKKSGYWIVGMDAEAEQDMKALTLDRPLIMVLGNEGKGMRPLVRNTCDWKVKIAGSVEVSSLNVSNAAAIALYQLAQISE